MDIFWNYTLCLQCIVFLYPISLDDVKCSFNSRQLLFMMLSMPRVYRKDNTFNPVLMASFSLLVIYVNCYKPIFLPHFQLIHDS